MTQQTNMESDDEELSSGDLNLYEEISEDLLDYSEDDEDERYF